MVRYALFLGCNIPWNYPDIEQSVRKTLPRLGIELEDMLGYTCCTTPGLLPSIDETAWLAVSARNLSIAEEMGLNVMTICNGCYSVLMHAKELLSDEKKKRKVNELLKLVNRQYRGTSEVYHVIHVLYDDVGTEKIKKCIQRRLDGFKVALEVGCHITWPTRLFKRDPERILRELVESLGAKVVDYSEAPRCCGGSGFRAFAPEKSYMVTKIKLDSIRNETDADIIVTVCPTCFMQFDEAQVVLKKAGLIDYFIPVFSYTQLLALCMGFDPKEVAVISKTPRDEIIARICAK